MTIAVHDEAADLDFYGRILEDALPLVGEWADVLEYRRGQCIVLARHDTDGRALRIPVGSIRQAIRRIGRYPERVAMNPTERWEATNLSHPGPELADLIVQVAAVGRVLYR